MGDKWQHDMYENGSGGVTPTTPTRGNTAGTGKLHISNLDYGVSDDDIRVSLCVSGVHIGFYCVFLTNNIAF